MFLNIDQHYVSSELSWISQLEVVRCYKFSYYFALRNAKFQMVGSISYRDIVTNGKSRG